MRNNEQILKLLTANGNYMMWVGLIQSNISNHNLLNAIVVHTLAEHLEEDFAAVEEEKDPEPISSTSEEFELVWEESYATTYVKVDGSPVLISELTLVAETVEA